MGCQEPTHKEITDCLKAYRWSGIVFEEPVEECLCEAPCWGTRLRARTALMRRKMGTNYKLREQHIEETKDIDINSIFLAFDSDIKTIIDTAVPQIPTIPILTIVNCYSDWGSPVQRAIATLINTFCAMETYHRSVYRGAKVKKAQIIDQGDGLRTMSSLAIDNHVHTAMRLHNAIRQDPLLYKIWFILFNRILKCEVSIFRQLEKLYPEQSIIPDVTKYLFNPDHHKLT